MPGPGGYWLPRPATTASAAARAISIGPSRSGNPWPRLIDPVATARADISAKIVVPRPARRRFSKGRLTPAAYSVLATGGRPPWHPPQVLATGGPPPWHPPPGRAPRGP